MLAIFVFSPKHGSTLGKKKKTARTLIKFLINPWYTFFLQCKIKEPKSTPAIAVKGQERNPD